MGSSKYNSTQFSGDSMMFSAVMFVVLKCLHDKYHVNKGKVSVEEASNADEVGEKVPADADCLQSATVVVDTMKVKPPPDFAKSSEKNAKRLENVRNKLKKRTWSLQHQSEATIWLSSWMRTPALNPKAKKFMPYCSHWLSTLDSDAPVFVPRNSEYAKKEKDLLKSQSGGVDTGAVVY